MSRKNPAAPRLGQPQLENHSARRSSLGRHRVLVTFLTAAWVAVQSALVLGEDTSKKKPAPKGGAKTARASSPSIYANSDGKAQVTLFGLTGEGYKFVYVMDRSASMGGSGRQALRIVKAELIESLKTLDRVHQFQIIFYNERPAVFNPSGVAGRLAFATEENKDRAERFIRSIVADGNTRHDDALKLAIGMRPDVIFFLTDGDDPKLSRSDLDRIEQMAGGITIHAIEFGSGPKPEGKSFLAELAKENMGQYVYVDISKDDAGKAEKPGQE